MKLIKIRNYANVGRIFFKTANEDFNSGLRLLEDDNSAIDFIAMCLEWGGCEIYVNHRVDDLVL